MQLIDRPRLTSSNFAHNLRPMKIFVIAVAMVCAAAQAAPQGKDQGIYEQIAQETTLLQQLGYMRDTVGTQASELVLNAMGFLGVPYKRGGSNANTGFDCSGFVRSMYEQTVGLILPRRAEEQARATQEIAREELKPGDLVFFNTMRRAFSHVGIYLGDGKFIHSPRSGSHVRVEDMREAYWTKRFNGARRVEGAAVPPALMQEAAKISN